MSPSKQAGASFLFGDRIDPEWNGAAWKEIGSSGGFQRNELVGDSVFVGRGRMAWRRTTSFHDAIQTLPLVSDFGSDHSASTRSPNQIRRMYWLFQHKNTTHETTILYLFGWLVRFVAGS